MKLHGALWKDAPVHVPAKHSASLVKSSQISTEILRYCLCLSAQFKLYSLTVFLTRYLASAV